MALYKLDEAATFARRNLDVGDFTEALEEGAELVLSDIARQATDEDGGVVGVGELIHGLGSAIVAHGRSAHGVNAHARTATLLGHAHASGAAWTTALVLGSGSRDTHWSIAAVDTLHLGERLLLLLLAGKSNEAVAARHSANRVRHYFSRLGGLIAVLEELDEDKLGDLGAKVANEDGELWATLVTAVASQLVFEYRREGMQRY